MIYPRETAGIEGVDTFYQEAEMKPRNILLAAFLLSITAVPQVMGQTLTQGIFDVKKEPTHSRINLTSGISCFIKPRNLRILIR